MKVRLSIGKKGATLYEGPMRSPMQRASGALWAQMKYRRLQKTTSIGALMEISNEDVVEELNGARIGLEKL